MNKMKRKRALPKYERVTFWKTEIKKIPTVVKFRRKDGSLATIKTLKRVSTPKKVSFLRKRK